MKRILILDDNLTICLMLKAWLRKQNYHADIATSVEDAKQKVKNEACDLILSDIRMPEADGFSFLSWVKKFDSDILVIMMTSYADIETAVKSMKSGAVDYIAKPIEEELLYKKIADALRNQENLKRAERMREHLIKPPGEAYKDVFDQLDTVVHTNSHLLIIGGHGTGKTSAAKYIYSKKGKDPGPFIIFDVDPYTVNRAVGKGDFEFLFNESMEKAKGGMLLVKSIENADINVQDQLLRVLTAQKKDHNFVQIVLTAKNNFAQLKDNLLPKLTEILKESYIELPSLKGNKDAILFYTEYFLDLANKELDKNVKKMDDEIFTEFFKQPWNGNIQELKNQIFKACLLTEGNTISKNILPVLFKNVTADLAGSTQPVKLPIEGLKKENYEKEKITEALEIAKGNKTMAASILNIDRKTLYNKIKLYNVEVI